MSRFDDGDLGIGTNRTFNKMNDGDWICSDPNCGNINFSRRTSCYRCNKEKPEAVKPFKKVLGTEIGKSAAEKSRGLFNADDWQCNKCANVNWARRTTCNVCNAPKFGEVEARTGYGGGYNERGVVEYRRRESSSSDEYDEFGRKKRKRKSDSQRPEPEDKVGTTEGPVFKKLPPKLLKGSQMEHMPAPASKDNQQEKISGSLSDGSVCDFPPLSKMAFRRNQVQSQTNYSRQDHMLPHNRSNGYQQRKRYSSTGDRDQAGSSGYETGSKWIRYDNNEVPLAKTFNPVMENRVSSTNEVVYKFTGPTPAEDFQVTYTLEERVKAAAFAIVYNNCKISTSRFESLFDKPAPDFKTIFGWRQRLLKTGCLVDTHLEIKKDIVDKPAMPIGPVNNDFSTKKNVALRLPNPDEIPISISDSEDESPKSALVQNISLPPSRQRSMSVETLLIGGVDNDIRPAGSSISTLEDQGSQAGSHSRSTRHHNHSSSRDSQDSNYPDTDFERQQFKTSNSRSTSKTNIPISTKQSTHDSDSDSISYNSDADDFLSRVYKGKKTKRKVKKRPVLSTPITTPVKVNSYEPNPVPPFQGYSTIKQTEQSPLATGNIYTSNMHNMSVKSKDNVCVDTDTSEYVPRLGAVTKKKYQAFRDNVRKKGFWARANGQSISNKPKVINPVIKPAEASPAMNPYIGQQNLGYISVQQAVPKSRDIELAKDNINSFVPGDPYKSFEKPLIVATPKSPENTSRIFDVVQSNSATKNRSIMDIFDSSEQFHESPERNDGPDKCDGVRKMFEMEWDDDDDDLYKNTDSIEVSAPEKRTPSPPSVASVRAHSPLSNLMCPQDVEMKDPISNPRKITMDDFRERHDNLLHILKDHQENREKEISDGEPNNIDMNLYEPSQKSAKTNKKNIQVPEELTVTRPEAIPSEISKEIIGLSESPVKNTHKHIPKPINPSKRVHIIESITIKPNDMNESFSSKEQTIVEPEEQSNVMQYFASNPIANANLSSTNCETNVINTIDIPLPQPTVEPEEVEKPVETVAINDASKPAAPQLDLSNLLAGINTNTILLALQNLQQLAQTPSNNTSIQNDQLDDDQEIDDGQEMDEENDNSQPQQQQVETINLTNDEEWEKESDQEGSIERELEKMDGNTGDTPFLSDIFDPGPIVIPPNVAKKLNLNLKKPDDKTDTQAPHLNENAPVIGNFKSFALPKPILLNRLKLTVKAPEKSSDQNPERKRNKLKKGKSSAPRNEEGEEEDEEEESGDEADLSKYDLWGSDEEQNNSKNDGDKTKDGESSKEGGSDPADKSASPQTKNSKRRSRSSSSSSSSSTSSSSSQSTEQEAKNKFDDFNLNSERECSPRGRKSRTRSRSPRSRSANAPPRRKSRDSRSAGESRSSRDKERSRDRERRDKSRGKERRYSREGNLYGGRGRHR